MAEPLVRLESMTQDKTRQLTSQNSMLRLHDPLEEYQPSFDPKLRYSPILVHESGR
jgi:hypothetical protein